MKRPQHGILSILGQRFSTKGTRRAASAAVTMNGHFIGQHQQASSIRVRTCNSGDWNRTSPSIRYASSSPAAAYNQTVDAFPSIVIGSNGKISPQGPFAEAQAQVSSIFHKSLDLFI